ncbi:MAG: hydrogenase maturation nickel metallochaperone HypA [Brevinematales bacterium]|nr:hydrogenase maturation nickel metallochaperone HypA [Brevinematales bacterium]
MYLKDFMGNSISDDAEFEDLEDFDYVDEFVSKDDDEYDEYDDEYDDLDDLYVDEEDDFIDDEDDFDYEDDEYDEYDETDDEVFDGIDEEVEVEFICEDCGHKWLEMVPETDDENDAIDMSCPICGSTNVTSLN